MTAAFAPGDLVQARGREWVSLPTSLPGLLCLRPLTGSEADIQLLDPALEHRTGRAGAVRFAQDWTIWRRRMLDGFSRKRCVFRCAVGADHSVRPLE